MDKILFVWSTLLLVLSSPAATEYGVCKSCYDGYTGEQCTQPLCYGESTCLNGGTCSSPNNCTCPDKFVGSKCEQALCFGSVTCSNGGTCVGPDNCSCPSGYSGEHCETETKPHSGRGSSTHSSDMFLVFIIVKMLHSVLTDIIAD